MMEDAGAACGPGGEKGGGDSKIGQRYEHRGKSTGRGEWEKVGVSQRNRKDPRGAVRGNKCGTRSKATGLSVW